MREKLLDKVIKKFGYMKLEEIIIPNNFKTPKAEKLQCKAKFYEYTGKFLDRVIVNNYGQLLDGYTTFFLAKAAKQKYIKVEFINMLRTEYMETFRKYKNKEREYANRKK